MARESSVDGESAARHKMKAGDIPTSTFGKTGIEVSVIAQGGARMDLHPTVQAAAAHVRAVYDLGVTYFDCARLLGWPIRGSVRHRTTERPEGCLPHDQDPGTHGEGRGAGPGDLPPSPDD